MSDSSFFTQLNQRAGRLCRLAVLAAFTVAASLVAGQATGQATKSAAVPLLWVAKALASGPKSTSAV